MRYELELNYKTGRVETLKFNDSGVARESFCHCRVILLYKAGFLRAISAAPDSKPMTLERFCH